MLTLLFALAAPLQATSGATGAYWQQDVRYDIVARLDEGPGVLTGRARIVYKNNSPDTLTEFYVHQYLNAFRPGSRWADRDSIEGRRRFNDLKDPDYAFERISRSVIDGVPVTPTYPYTPDSTIARFELPDRLAPGDSITVEIDWQARPSTVPRRQGRRGRRFDFAQWYPRVVVYDRYGWEAHPLYPAGEFYGEFGTYDVTLDLARDQVIGATGVPVEGDPGWSLHPGAPGTTIDYQRDWYTSRGSNAQNDVQGCRGIKVASGRKCVHFHAEDVHHFAMSLNPDYIYEQGRYGNTVVRVLYQPDDRTSWGGNVAVRRTEIALAWLGDLFGPFPWPQITNVHRIEGGGTEFPMMVMNGSASQGLILHEGGHNYLMGILGNNEWKEGFLDEGFTSFQTTWFFEENAPGFDGYSGIEQFILSLDLDGFSEPTSLVSEDYSDFQTYNAMIYTRGQLFYHQLRNIVGRDTMKQILREYYRRWKLKHVDEDAFREVAEEVSGRDLKTFFAQWLHSDLLYDYAIGDVKRTRLPDGRWRTEVEINRKEPGQFPVEIGEASGEPRAFARAVGRAKHETVSFVTDRKPGRLMLDPRRRSHDWNYTNNYEGGFLTFPGTRWRLDNFVEDPGRRDAPVTSVAPVGWFNDSAGVTLGLRIRSNYMNRYNRFELTLERGFDDVHSTVGNALDFHVKLENPTLLRAPNAYQSLEGWIQEGTAGIGVERRQDFRKAWWSPDVLHVGFLARWVVTSETAFLNRRLWENAGTAEFGGYIEWDAPTGKTGVNLRLDYTGGYVYARKGSGTRLNQRFDSEPFARGSFAAAFKRQISSNTTAGIRGYVGGYLADNNPVPQRAIQVAGADPYQTLGNPFVRTGGAILVRPRFFYHSPGGANLRGFAPGLGGRWAAAVNLELTHSLYSNRRGVLRNASLVLFGDAGLVDTLAVASTSGDAATGLYDAGPGVRIGLHIGDLDFPLRVEFPLLVSRPEFAHNTRQGLDDLEFRWLVSLEQTF